MPPLILHNVPDEELYIGDDGIKRPYAMVFPPQQDGTGSLGRSRKAAHESGAFGKSTRRSRSKTGTPARREDPTIAAADRVFSNWHADQNQNPAPTSTSAAPRKSNLSQTSSQKSLGQALDDAAVPPAGQARFLQQQEPTEVILRGYRSPEQQYAAINHYEQVAGRICEDYPREPPMERRRYKSELQDTAFTRRRAPTAEERAKVNKADGGEHWVKVTFESAEAADTAMYASPQSILGHLVYAEPYHGVGPERDEPVVDTSSLISETDESPSRRRSGNPSVNVAGFTRAAMAPGGDFDYAPSYDEGSPTRRRSGNSNVNVAAFTRAMMVPGDFDFSPPHSQTSSRTADTTTVASTIDTGTVSSGTVTGGRGSSFASGIDASRSAHSQLQGRGQTQQQLNTQEEDEFCRAIPSVRKARLLPVEQALLPAPSVAARFLSYIPVVKWFSGTMIGNEVPRTETGEFDFSKASMYWKIIWWLDNATGIFGKEIVNADKDE